MFSIFFFPLNPGKDITCCFFKWFVTGSACHPGCWIHSELILKTLQVFCPDVISKFRTYRQSCFSHVKSGTRQKYFPGGAVVKNPPANAENEGDTGMIPGLGRSPGEWNGNLLQYSCLENPMDRGLWRATMGWQRVGVNTHRHTHRGEKKRHRLAKTRETTWARESRILMTFPMDIIPRHTHNYQMIYEALCILKKHQSP